MCAGGKYLAEAYASLVALRKSGCALSVCIVHADAAEVSAKDTARFHRAFGESVSFVDASSYNLGVDPTTLRGFELKAYALLLVPFEHVLLLDADCAPLCNDPSFLFHDPAYKAYGNIFWPDYQIHQDLVRPWMVPAFAQPVPPGFETESGQLVVNTRRCRKALVYAWLLNKHSDIFYKHYYGDKDLYRIGFLMAGLPFFQVRFSPGILGYQQLNDNISFTMRLFSIILFF